MWDGDVVHEWAVGDGSVVEYSDDGAGPPIILIHAGVFADWFGPHRDRAARPGVPSRPTATGWLRPHRAAIGAQLDGPCLPHR
jgi:hypothetical protein